MKIVVLALVVSLVTLLAGPTASVATTDPVGGCSPPFHLHSFHEHHGEHPHRLVGVARDINGDGWTCVQHVSADGSIHVHVDNAIPLP